MQNTWKSINHDAISSHKTADKVIDLIDSLISTSNINSNFNSNIKNTTNVPTQRNLTHTNKDHDDITINDARKGIQIKQNVSATDGPFIISNHEIYDYTDDVIHPIAFNNPEEYHSDYNGNSYDRLDDDNTNVNNIGILNLDRIKCIIDDWAKTIPESDIVNESKSKSNTKYIDNNFIETYGDDISPKNPTNKIIQNHDTDNKKKFDNNMYYSYLNKNMPSWQIFIDNKNIFRLSLFSICCKILIWIMNLLIIMIDYGNLYIVKLWIFLRNLYS